MVASIWLLQCCGAPGSPEVAGNNNPSLSSPRLRLGEGDWPVELAQDNDWRKAATGDEWALLHIARRRDLLRAGVERGGPAAEIALRAWPLAPEAWVERGTLCRVLTQYIPEDWGSLLRALRKSAAERDAFGEELDPEASMACEGALAELDGHTAAMNARVFDEYIAACQALGRAASRQR